MAQRGVNKVILIGHLGQDPEVRYMPNGNAVANISMATSETWKDKATGEDKERTEWHRVVFYGKLAEIVGEYLRSGSQIYIEGRLQTRKWQTAEQPEIDRYTTEIVVDVNGTMQMLGSKPAEGAAKSAAKPAAKPSAAAAKPAAAASAESPVQNNVSAESQKPAENKSTPAPVYNEPPMDFDDDIPF